MGSGVDVSSQVAAALKNPLSLPSALQFAFDPANNSRIMQGIKNTQAGFLYWQDRLGIDGAANFQARETAATAIGNSIKEMAI